MKHSDTSLWFIQAATGFVMFFLIFYDHLITRHDTPDKILPAIAKIFHYDYVYFFDAFCLRIWRNRTPFLCRSFLQLIMYLPYDP